MKNLKLIEAIGLFLILSSIGLEWSVYRTYDDATKSFVDHFRNLQDIYIVYSDLANSDFRDVVSRSLIINEIRKPGSYQEENTFDELWNSTRVKQLWTKKIVSNIRAYELYIRSIESTNKKYNLKREEQIAVLRKSINNFEKPFMKMGSINFNTTYNLSDKITADVAKDVENSFSQLPPMVMAEHDEIKKLLSKKRDRWSFFFRILYFLGSLFVIFPVLCEWWSGRSKLVK